MRGSYILIVYLEGSSRIEIGRLAEIDFEKGYYAYVGSAMGRGDALENRIKRYRRLAREKKGNLFWHIDYFLVHPGVKIEKVLTLESDRKIECRVSQRLSRLAKKTVKDFGSSDCKCRGHFHYLGKDRSGVNFASAIKKIICDSAL